MITLNKIDGQLVTKNLEFMCLSTDVDSLPTDNVPNGSNAFLMDTNEVIFFDEENGTWLV
ncbi:MAG: hypothetical protein KBT03_04145 [Bacteroidales bacterium]|nr:hypothetical protein [Candidatus Scybalousia scybalohippi]